MALVFLNFGLSHTEASYSSIIMTTEPLLTALLAAILLEERLTLFQSFGGVVILGSLLLLTMGEHISVKLQSERMGESKKAQISKDIAASTKARFPTAPGNDRFPSLENEFRHL